jgi:hypothetical protein
MKGLPKLIDRVSITLSVEMAQQVMDALWSECGCNVGKGCDDCKVPINHIRLHLSKQNLYACISMAMREAFLDGVIVNPWYEQCQDEPDFVAAWPRTPGADIHIYTKK